jgi:hypothetical protein
MQRTVQICIYILYFTTYILHLQHCRSCKNARQQGLDARLVTLHNIQDSSASIIITIMDLKLQDTVQSVDMGNCTHEGAEWETTTNRDKEAYTRACRS